MDKQLSLILLIFALSFVIGVMDKVKHHWSSTCFSTVSRPNWLAKYLNPHYTLVTKWPVVNWLLKHTLAGLGDFWHTLKAIMLQLIFFSIWRAYNEWNIWLWLLTCNAIYGVIFEVTFMGMFNKKEK